MYPFDAQVALRLVTPPEQLPVTVDEAKAHLRVDSDDEDGLIQALLTAAVDMLDGKSGHLFRCIMPQTWRMALDGGFPGRNGGRISLPLGPVISVEKVTSIEYIDTAGAAQSLPSQDWRFYAADGLDDAYILPAWGKSWPATRCDVEAVAITYVAGYADIVAVPLALRQAILLQTADLYNNRESAMQSETVLNATVERLLAPYRRVMV